ncbi:MAG: hypothetical protein R6U32_04750 [Candidatus Woesearchaeota archaeon]
MPGRISEQEKWRREQGIAEAAANARIYRPVNEYYQIGFNMNMHDIIQRAEQESLKSGDYSSVLVLEMWAERPYEASLDGKLETAKEQLREKTPQDIRDILLLYIGRVTSPLNPRRSFSEFYNQVRKELGDKK